MTSLQQFAKNTYSQNGEDGIIAEILRRVSQKYSIDKWCVEFGAWDGVYLSNTCRLLRESHYKGVLIEGSSRRVKQLYKNFPSPQTIKICRMVSFEGQDSLDAILEGTPIPINFDFLSIDVDGVDYYILESLKNYTPKVICIEFNPTIPSSVEFVQQRSFEVKQGSSAKAINALANGKGYTTVAITHCNLILVRNHFLDAVVSSPLSLETLMSELKDPLFEPTYIFCGYDGTILSNKKDISLNWHSISIPVDRLQLLPPYLRTFSGDYGIIKRGLLSIYRLIKNRKDLISKFKQRLFKYSRKS